MSKNIRLRRWTFYFVTVLLIITNVVTISSCFALQSTQEADHKKFLTGFCNEFFLHFSDRLINETDTDAVTADEIFARWLPLTRAAGIWVNTSPTAFNSNLEVMHQNLMRLEYDFWDFGRQLEKRGALTAEQHTLLLKIKAALPELQAGVFIEGATGELRSECLVGTYFVDQFIIFFEQIYGEI